MSWVKIRKEEEMGKYRDYDMVVRKKYIYFPKGSRIYKAYRDGMFERYDLLVDRESGRVAICMNNGGEYKYPSDSIIRRGKGYVHTVVRIINEILGVGKYVAKEESIEVDGKYRKCWVFGGGKDGE